MGARKGFLGTPSVSSRRKLDSLHELPSPSSDWTARQPHARWVARNDDTPATESVTARAPPRSGGLAFRSIAMSHYAIPIDQSCGSYRPGHQVHWIHAKKASEKDQPLIAVSVTFRGDGWVDIEGRDLSLTLWTHEATRLHQCSACRAQTTVTATWPLGTSEHRASRRSARPPTCTRRSIACSGRRGHTAATQFRCRA